MRRTGQPGIASAPGSVPSGPGAVNGACTTVLRWPADEVEPLAARWRLHGRPPGFRVPRGGRERPGSPPAGRSARAGPILIAGRGVRALPPAAGPRAMGPLRGLPAPSAGTARWPGLQQPLWPPPPARPGCRRRSGPRPGRPGKAAQPGRPRLPPGHPPSRPAGRRRIAGYHRPASHYRPASHHRPAGRRRIAGYHRPASHYRPASHHRPAGRRRIAGYHRPAGYHRAIRQRAEELAGQARQRGLVQTAIAVAITIRVHIVTGRCTHSRGTCRPRRRRAPQGRRRSGRRASSTARSGRTQSRCVRCP